MPIYEYRCRECGRIQEFLIIGDANVDIVCPDCGSKVMHEGGCVTCLGCGFFKCE